MRTSITLTHSELQHKLKKLDEEKKLIEYLIENYFSESQKSSLSLFDNKIKAPINLDASQNTKPLIIDILKLHGKMRWTGVWDIFHPLKPEISRGTVQVSLSQMSRSQKHPVKQKNGIYWYEEKVN